MYRVIVFAGTTEGNEICSFLAANKVPVWACVATEYGSKSLEEGTFLHVSAKRMTTEEMQEFFQRERPELVVDATHPYAAEVTQNIRLACEETGFPYQRVLREQGQHQKKAVYVENTEAAVEYLKHTSGNILLTTGSKELAKFTVLPNYQQRLYARVLSLSSVMETCRELGLEGRNLIGMQGPFSKELNAAMLRQYDCVYLVTKDTGNAGGFQEKMDAAEECGVIPVIIGRPLEETGVSVAECKKMLTEHFAEKEINKSVLQNTLPASNKNGRDILECEKKEAEYTLHGFQEQQIILVGIGMGSLHTATTEARKAVEKADLLIGAKRMLEAVTGWNGAVGQKAVLQEYRSEVIADYIKAHQEYKRIAILLSGDVGFYSGAKKLLDVLGEDTRVICGISSVVYFMSRIGLSWEDAKIVSAHGRSCNLVSWVKQYQKVFAILGTGDGVAELAKKLDYYGMGEIWLYVGENLSYENENIFVKQAKELLNYQGDSLSVVCTYNENAVSMAATHGIKDEEFQRGGAPMTKEEVRTVSLAKLQLKESSICYDVGAGTGSVAVEMALRAHQGKVYAIEKKEVAAELIEENKRKFAVDNLEIIRGEAPEALEALPVPTHVFIGGSSGNLKQILQALLEKNANVRIVINCITLETVTEALEAIRQFEFTESEIVQLGVSRAKELGRYHLMMGENPIYVISCQKSNFEKENNKEQ